MRRRFFRPPAGTEVPGQESRVKQRGGIVRHLLGLPAAMLLGYLAGRWFDTRLDTAPWLALAGVVFGFGAALALMVADLAPEVFRRHSRGG